MSPPLTLSLNNSYTIVLFILVPKIISRWTGVWVVGIYWHETRDGEEVET